MHVVLILAKCSENKRAIDIITKKSQNNVLTIVRHARLPNITMFLLLLIHCLIFFPLVCRSSVFGYCFVKHCVAPILLLRTRKMLAFLNCLPDVLRMSMFCGSSWRCGGLVCSV